MHKHRSEYATRKERIDGQLKTQGWTVTRYDPVRSLNTYNNAAVEEFPTANGPADYALFTRGRLVGIVEAKKLTVGPQNVLTQAERYARGIDQTKFNFNGLRAPFLYSTNGEVIWFHDVRHPLNRSHRIATFHTPAALEELLARDFDAACHQLQALPNSHPLLRPYQLEANVSTEQAIAERKHQMLIAMATGTGKFARAMPPRGFVIQAHPPGIQASRSPSRRRGHTSLVYLCALGSCSRGTRIRS